MVFLSSINSVHRIIFLKDFLIIANHQYNRSIKAKIGGSNNINNENLHAMKFLFQLNKSSATEITVILENLS